MTLLSALAFGENSSDRFVGLFLLGLVLTIGYTIWRAGGGRFERRRKQDHIPPTTPEE